NEANRIAAAEEAARVVAEQEVETQAAVAAQAARNAAEAMARSVGAAYAAAAAAAPQKTEAALDRDERVAIQKRLPDLGFFRGSANGSFGPATRQAIAAYQQANKSGATGMLTPEQIAALLHE